MERDLFALNRQAITAAQKYMGELAWATVALSAIVLTVFSGSPWLFAAGSISLWAVTLIFAGITFVPCARLHPAAHESIMGKHVRLKWPADLRGSLCAAIVMVPYSTYKSGSFSRHRYTCHYRINV